MTPRYMDAVWLTLLVGTLTGACHSPPRSTTMTIADYELIADEIAAQLRQDFTVGYLSRRHRSSPRMIIAIQKITNYTSDLMSDSAKWLLVRKLSDSLNRAILKQKNVVFVIPAEYVREDRWGGDLGFDDMIERRPTHVMSAEFRSAMRAAEGERTEAYQCDYEIRSLDYGEVVWSGQVMFKRWARGRLWD